MSSTAPNIVGGRARSGRNTQARTNPQGTLVPVSFAKQTKSQEERLYSRFRELDPEAVRVTRYRNGSIEEEVCIKTSGAIKWITTMAAEIELSQLKEKKIIQIAIMRAPVRLGKVLASEEEYHAIPSREQDILRMSQRIYNSFRASQEAIRQAQARPGREEGNSLPKAGPPGPAQQ
jgi:hypothetical protein